METSEKERTVIGKAVDTVLIPVHAAASKPAQKAYLSTFLFVTASLFLFGVSSVAYALFYYNYVPQIGVERLVHLQFGNGNPHGTASLSSALTSQQAYDISLILHLPRTANNVAAGNFMLDLSLLSPDAASSASDTTTSALIPNLEVLARSRRPAILTYASPMIDAASTLSGLLWYILGWKKESEILKVGMFEGVEFAKGWKNVPQSVEITVESDLKMQFYDVGIEIVARFGGLRWILYHHRIFSFLFFTSAFWISATLSALVAWFFLATFFSPRPIKPEPSPKPEPSDAELLDPFSTEDFSDTARTFPTLGRQVPPLQYPPPLGRNPDQQQQQQPKSAGGSIKDEEERWIKKEEEDDVRLKALGIPPPPAEAEADDEGDDDEEMESAAWRDSGIGTGLDDGDRSLEVHRRRRALFGTNGRGA